MKFLYYIVDEEGIAAGTNDLEQADLYREQGCAVIYTQDGSQLWDSRRQPIKKAAELDESGCEVEDEEEC